MLQQPDPTPLALGEQVALLAAAEQGRMDQAAESKSADEMAKLLDGLLEHIRSERWVNTMPAIRYI